jgi:hypothetical protein
MAEASARECLYSARVSCVLRFWCGLCLSGLLLACSPALNWREVRTEAGDLTALLPCKPDRASRLVPLGGAPTRLLMMGCEAGGALFAVALADLGDASSSAEVLEQWQVLTLSHMRATQPQRQTVVVAGADRQPAAVLLVAQGVHPDGQPVQGQSLFFARGSLVYQASIYAPRIVPEAAETFFASIKLP